MRIETEQRDGPVGAPDAPESSTDLDIYALLGVTPKAPAALARQLYWVKVDQHQQAKERGEAGAARAIEELNEALSILLDSDRRAAYDRARRTSEGGTRGGNERHQARRARAGAVMAVMLVTLGGTLGAAWWGGPLVLAVVSIIGMLALVTSVAWQRRDGLGDGTPFILLGLRDGAEAPEVHAAYEMAVQELLSRVKVDPDAIRRLDRLDRAYIEARRLLEERDGQVALERPRFASRVATALGRLVLAVAASVLGFLGDVALLLRRRLARVMAGASRAVSRRLRAESARGIHHAADHLATLSRMIQGTPIEEPRPIVSVDLGRRVAPGLFPRLPEGVGAGGESNLAPGAPLTAVSVSPAHDEHLVEAYLVLEAAAGRRRIPIGAVPLRIGSGPDCHLVLPPELGLSPEHALIWQRDGVLLMHVVDLAAGACMVNDEPMTWASLEDGDVIQLAGARFTVAAPVSTA